MATKPTAKKPSKHSTPPAAAKATKTAKASPALTPKPSAKPAAKPGTAKVTKPSKPSTAKLARLAARNERAARHDKPGTGRVSRGASAEIMRPEGGAHDRRTVAPAALPANGLTCPIPKEELSQWRQILLGHRMEISQDISHLERDAMEAEDGHTTPNHLAERGSDAEMQDMSLGLAGEEQIVLWQIDRALRKIDSGVPLPFGLCEHSKQPIPKMRLQLIPWTPVSIEGMNYVEENGLALEDILVDG
jgi:RNA polymerase-binding transcription factor DksA